VEKVGAGDFVRAFERDSAGDYSRRDRTTVAAGGRRSPCFGHENKTKKVPSTTQPKKVPSTTQPNAAAEVEKEKISKQGGKRSQEVVEDRGGGGSSEEEQRPLPR